MLTSTADKADYFARKFFSNSTLDTSGWSLPDFLSRTEDLLSDIHITLSFVSAIISKLDPQQGLRNVLNWFPFPLYNKYLAAFCFPAHWKSSSAIPVFKNAGEPSDPSKYQPLSLLFFVKVLYAQINTELVKHLTSYKQYGFRFTRFTADMLMALTEFVF